MNPKQTIRAIKLSHQTKKPLMITGSPGVGKSDVVRQSADELNLQLHDLRATLLEPVDVAGVPATERNPITQKLNTNWAIPGWLPTTGDGILFLDEITSASQQVQIALYSLVLDRKINDYTLPDGWSVIAAGNRITDRAGTQAMPSALANRFWHVDFEPSLADWLDWAAKNNIASEITSFLNFKSKLLNDFDPKEKAFPTPRSWSMASTLCKAGIDDKDLFPFIAATVGDGAATEFTAFLKVYQDLPTVKEILADPKGAKKPMGAAAMYAISTTMAHAVTAANIQQVYTYMERFSGEYQTLMVKESLRIDKTIASTQTYVDWALNNADKIL
mgnify:CR=1 FL=1